MAAPSSSLVLSLPNELLHDTAVYLLPKDANAFMRTNRRLHHLLAPLLDRLLTQNADHVLSCAVITKKERFFELAVSRGADSNRLLPGSINLPLYYAVTNGWDNSVKLLIDNGAYGIGSYYCGYTALHIAVRSKHLSTTRLLLDRGWSPSVAADSVGDTSPLHLAILVSTDEIIELLIERGTDVNARDEDLSPLESAVRCPTRGLSIIKMILTNGFDPSNCNSRGEPALDTAFCDAVRTGEEVIAKFLLEQGADINFKFHFRRPKLHETALHTAIRFAYWPMVEMLVRSGIEINAQNRYKENALFVAAIGRKPDDTSGRSFLCFEADGMMVLKRPALLPDFKTSDRLPVMKLLFDAGIDVNARDHENETVLFRAACRGSAPIVQLLLHHGADIHAQNSKKLSTALHAAAGCGDFLVVQVLLANGSDINARTKNGSTALHIALQHGDMQSANFLLDNGIDITIRTTLLHHLDHNPCIADGASALYLAVRWGYKDFAKRLLANGARVDVRYHLKSLEGDTANEPLRGLVIKMFDESGLNPLILCEGENGDADTTD